MAVLIIILVVILASLVFAEWRLRHIIRNLRKNFQWLITEGDEHPELPKDALNKFINSSFDQQLGWVRKPNTSGIERGKKGEITFHIDDYGSRVSSMPELTKQIAVFGDSYAFCRQVTDEETWEEGIARRLNIGVLNFGVGNYGADQALIRYRSQELPPDVKVVVMCFVPETICRIQSYWKHYLEFGNTFAFKPRFNVSSEGKLELVENIIKTPSDFQNLATLLPIIQKHDEFYLRKFRKYQFRNLYISSFFRAPKRHMELIRSLRAGKKSETEVSTTNTGDAFALVMKDNIREARDMYDDQRAIELLHKILLDFVQLAESRGHLPLILVIPQLLDFYEDKSKPLPYSRFFDKLSREMNVIDMADLFRGQPIQDIYIDDRYGGHLSAEGNDLVAETVSNWLKKMNILKF